MPTTFLHTAISEHDLHLFNEGTHYRLYEKLGAHPAEVRGRKGCRFAVWAPNAEKIFVRGDFNNWSTTAHPLCSRENSGIWEGFIGDVGPGSRYKYHVVHRSADASARGPGKRAVDKADPFAFGSEIPPRTGSVVSSLEHSWNDDRWMKHRAARNSLGAPISIYEIHLGSWMRPLPPADMNGSKGRENLGRPDGSESERPWYLHTYRQLAPLLTQYVRKMGFTHVEFLPVMEHPFYGSWGYQGTGYFAPSSRYGSPQDLMYLIDYLHQHDIGVILDWVPSHFATDEHGLGQFDGTALFEHADPRQGRHPDWDSYIFNYGRNEVRAFLISNALYWLEKYHVDGLRVDAVASMLYLDYSRKSGEWIPNRFGGNENIEAIEFLRTLNTVVYQEYPDTLTVAEESTSWPMVSRPTYIGGLGFGGKWDMGWMHDTLQYFGLDPVFRKFDHNKITFRAMYAFSENFILPLSHDEVVHGKGSLLNKMPGDEPQKFANLRLLLALMFAQPGKKLLFMGGEFGQQREWNHETELQWDLLQSSPHADLQRWVKDLNGLHRRESAMHDQDSHPDGFRWLDCHDAERSVLSFLRLGVTGEQILVVCNFTPVVRENYRVGVPRAGYWEESLNSDATYYGGAGGGNFGGRQTSPVPFHGHQQSLNLTLPGLAALFFKYQQSPRKTP